MGERDRKSKSTIIGRFIYLTSSFVIYVVLLCYSCVFLGDIDISECEQFIENVPFYPQKKYQCGPAALAAVLNYWGVSVSSQEVSDEIFSKSARGTLTIDMVVYAQKMGLKATYYKGDIENIKRNISDGFPTIVLVDLGFAVYKANHFMVVIGYNQHGVIVNSGKHRHKLFSWKDFRKAWEKTNFWTLLVTPNQK